MCGGGAGVGVCVGCSCGMCCKLCRPLVLCWAASEKAHMTTQSPIIISKHFIFFEEVRTHVHDSSRLSLIRMGLLTHHLCLFRSEQLLRERMRATGSGITNYDYIEENDSLVVHGSQCVVVDRQTVSNAIDLSRQCGHIYEFTHEFHAKHICRPTYLLGTYL